MKNPTKKPHIHIPIKITLFIIPIIFANLLILISHFSRIFGMTRFKKKGSHQRMKCFFTKKNVVSMIKKHGKKYYECHI